MPTRALLLDAMRSDISGWAAPAASIGSLEALAAHLRRPLRVAVVRLDGIGDWILTLPLVTALESADIVSDVTLVAPPAVAGLLSGHAGVTVETVDLSTTFAPRTFSRRLGKLLATARPAQRAARRAGKAARNRFDVVILPRWQVDRGYNARAWAVGTGAALAGHDPAGQPLAGAKERREGVLLAIRPLDQRPVVHEIERLRVLLDALGLPSVIAPAYGRRYFDADPSVRITTLATTVIHTGASEAKRVWPAESWRALIELLLQDPDRQVVLIGAPAERSGHEAIVSGLGDRATTVAGSIPFRSLPSVIGGAGMFMGCDSGPAHLAAALGVPSIVLSCHPIGADPAHANSPERFGPWGNVAEVVRPRPGGPECTDRCTHSDAHCIRGIDAESVAVAAQHTQANSAPRQHIA